jgi:regulator of protease activity HflC (stomatin/prohibitin superfamily)
MPNNIQDTVTGCGAWWVVLIVAIIILILWAIKIVTEYERGVIFRFGKYVGVRGPGLIIVIPMIEQMRRMDLRTITLDVPSQEVITRDNVTIRVNAVVYFRVLHPDKAVIQVKNFVTATSQIAQTTLRSVLGEHELDELLAQREKINQNLQTIIDNQTDPWGIKVSVVEVKDVELPEGMKRAMARQAEAERERRGKIIAAEGEFQAAERLAQAADIISRNPAALQLRYLQTLVEIAAEKNSTTLFPIPIDLFKFFSDKNK